MSLKLEQNLELWFEWGDQLIVSGIWKTIPNHKQLKLHMKKLYGSKKQKWIKIWKLIVYSKKRCIFVEEKTKTKHDL
jgi:hypothetical protein